MAHFDETSTPGADSPEAETPQTLATELDQEDDSDLDSEDRPPKIVPLKDSLPEDIARGIHTFDDLPLHDHIRQAIVTIGWKEPTPVQKLCLPYTLRGRDVAGFAQTGTGKTAVFLMTILNKLLATPTEGTPAEGRSPRAIVIAPTRELAMQGEQDAETLFAGTGLETLAVFGGVDYDKQARKLKDGVDVIFATPGRLKDYIQKKWLKLDDIQVFVCDEADRMFDMGFIEDVEFFLARIPESSQRLLFSATTNEQVKELAFEYLETPEYVSVNPETLTPEKIEQHAIHCHATEKLRVLIGLLREHNPECSIIFTNTKLTAEWLHFKLVGNGIEADLITGDLPQKKRIRLIQNIKEGKLKALIATDVASRGLHISRVTHVYNFDLPDDAANYVHRVGRTARAGARGFSYSLVCDDYGQNLAPINDLLGPTIALHTEWPNEAYLAIVDGAGDPFEGRWRKDRAGFDRPRAGAEFGRSGSGGRGDFRGRSDGRGRDDRPRRDDRESRGGRDRNEGRERDGGRERDPRGGGLSRDARGGRDQGNSQQSRVDPRRPAQAAAGMHAMGGADQEAGKRKRRRRGRGGQGDQQPGQQGQQGQSGQRQGGRGGRDDRNSRNQGQSFAGGAKSDAGEAAPKTVGGMLKKIVKTLFGWGK